MTYDREHHHRRSIRLSGHDYGGTGVYFITVCVSGREPLFGDVVAGDMRCNELGVIVWEEWRRSAEIRAELGLVAFVVMPNHVHGLVTFDPGERPVRFEPNTSNAMAQGGPRQRAPRSLGSFVSGFKGASTRRINTQRQMLGAPVWQRGYHEQIVRNENAFASIRHYIMTNPLRWLSDRENADRLKVDPFDTWLDEHAGGYQDMESPS